MSWLGAFSAKWPYFRHIIAQLQVFRLMLETEMLFNDQMLSFMQFYTEDKTRTIEFKNILLESNFGRKWIFCFFPIKFNLLIMY